MGQMTTSQFYAFKSQVTGANYLKVYWSYFWQRGKMGSVHLLTKPTDRGYSTREISERKTLCGEQVPEWDYHEFRHNEIPNDVCLKCLRSAALREQKEKPEREETYVRCQVAVSDGR